MKRFDNNTSRALILSELAGVGCITLGEGAEIVWLAAEAVLAASIWSNRAFTGDWPAPPRNTATLTLSRFDIEWRSTVVSAAQRR